MTDFPCVPACKSCREASVCAKPFTVREAQALIKPPSARSMYPQDLIRLPCGCMEVPWPLVTVLGSGISSIDCPNGHGEQKMTKAYLKKVSAESKKMSYAAIAKENPQGDLLDEPPF